MRGKLVLLSLLLVSTLPLARSAAAGVTIDPSGTSQLQTFAYDTSMPPGHANYLYPDSLPYANSASMVGGASTADSQYDLSESAFGISFQYTKATAPYSETTTWAKIYFSVDQPTAYEVTGAFDATNDIDEIAVFSASIYDVTDGSYVLQTGGMTQGEVNVSRTFSGLTGMLLVGHDYYVNFFASLETPATATSFQASATGNLSLAFATVPEPGTGVLLAAGLALLARRSRAR